MTQACCLHLQTVNGEFGYIIFRYTSLDALQLVLQINPENE